MITQISIDNFATIDHISFELGDGLNIITGETGTGKSVLIEAISTALGGRADISMVRTGTDKAVIQIAGSLGGEDVVISRELLASGKSVSRLNGGMVTLAQLRSFCKGFADVHGQYDNQLLLDAENHIGIIDALTGGASVENFAKLSGLHENWRNLKREYAQLLSRESEARRQRDFFEFEYNYINKLALRVGEDDELREQIDLMRNSGRIFNAVNRTYDIIHESEQSVISSMGSCMNELNSVSSYSDKLSDISASVADAYYRLEDVSAALRDLKASLVFSEEDMDAASERLSAIEDAKRKYSLDVEGIIAYGDELADKLQLIESFDSVKAAHADKIARLQDEMTKIADKIHAARLSAASSLEAAMKDELSDLEFANNEFAVKFTELEEIASDGYDAVEFSISTNPGEPLRPLMRVASGGEISRVMLAFKHILGDSDKTESMIFDEIDTGISGRTALTVGRKLKEISRHHQIICITHLPQIAACGDDNYLISKDLVDGRSSTGISRLDQEGKVLAVASLMSGNAGSRSSIEAARDLIQNK